MYEPDKGRGFGSLKQRINLGFPGGRRGAGGRGSGYNSASGDKYNTKYNEVPPPGYYQPEIGDSLTKTRARRPFISRSVVGGYKVPRDNNPDAGMYEPDKGTGFGSLK